MNVFNSLIKFLEIFYRAVKSIIKSLIGFPLTIPPLSSITLDIEDVHLAQQLLRDRRDWFDPKIVKDYEGAFAHWNGSAHAFAFMGGRVALSACIYALDLKAGDEVIIPGYTCVVVSNAFHFEGVKTIFSDIELDTYGLDASAIEAKITKNTKAIVLHHLYGLVCRDYEQIIQIGKKHGIPVIEDCAQSVGALFKDRKVGNLGGMAIYSSEQSKPFTTVQGGVATTNDDLLAKRLKEYWDRASYPEEELIDKQLHCVIINYYTHKDSQRWWRRDLIRQKYQDKIIITTTKEEEQGKKPAYYGSKMPAAIAALGLNQLEKIDSYNQKRRQSARKWDRWCDHHGYQKAVVVPDSVPVYLRYPVMVEAEKKSDISWSYKKLKVKIGNWFVSHLHPSNQIVKGCPNADKAIKQCVNFPGLI